MNSNPVSDPSILTREDGATIAYHRTAGNAPGVVFLGGFMSDMTGTKATALESFCRARGQAFLRFDYFGHGRSSGEFSEATVGRWKDDALCVLDNLTAGPQVLVGSSLGGWIMLLAARDRPARVKALIGIAPAPDATEDLMWSRFAPELQAAILRDGQARIPSAYGAEGYLITRKLIEDGRKHLVLRKPISISCPVRLIHGMRDADVPYRVSIELAEKLQSEDVRIELVKDGDHRLSREQDLALLTRQLELLLG
ncbi:MAG TPA: alpha/beta hydrolase [Stellaceae bacterium]|nr:alpha/beta hydrolase [Stellaceae bacterium]